MIGLTEVDGAWDAGFVTGAVIGAVIAIVSLKWDRICALLLDLLDRSGQQSAPPQPRPSLRLVRPPFDWDRDGAA